MGGPQEENYGAQMLQPTSRSSLFRGWPPPAGLDATEQAAWTALVDASPSFALDPAAQLILKRLVAQAALHEPQETRQRALRVQQPGR